MPNPFDTDFPGQAVGKGVAQVIQDDFAPDDAPPVEISDPSETHPVDPATGLPMIPVDAILANAGLEEGDLPGNVPEDVLDILF